MIEYILIFISLSFIISVISHISEKFNSQKELNLVCSLCVICVVLIPIIQDIPNIINHTDSFEIEIKADTQDDQYHIIKENIKNNVEESVKKLIKENCKSDVEINADIDFADMSSIRIIELRITTDGECEKSEIFKLIKSTYFCEVKIYENK